MSEVQKEKRVSMKHISFLISKRSDRTTLPQGMREKIQEVGQEKNRSLLFFLLVNSPIGPLHQPEVQDCL